MLTTTGGVILFFWLICEAVILGFLAQLWSARIMASGSSWKLGMLLTVMLAFMFCMTFFDISSQALNKSHAANWTLAYQLTVDAYCTLYVLLEACITLYAVFLFLAGQNLIKPNRDSTRWEQLKNKLNYRLKLVALLIGLAFAFLYVGYHYVYIDLVHADRLEDRFIYTGFHFYYVICGFLWVLINGMAAWIAYRIYKLIQNNKAFFYVES